MKAQNPGRWPQRFADPDDRERLHILALRPRGAVRTREGEAVRIYSGQNHEERWRIKQENLRFDWPGVRLCSRLGLDYDEYERRAYCARHGITVAPDWRPRPRDITPLDGRPIYNLLLNWREMRDKLTSDNPLGGSARLRAIIEYVTLATAHRLARKTLWKEPRFAVSSEILPIDFEDAGLLDRTWLSTVFARGLAVPRTRSGAPVGLVLGCRLIVEDYYGGSPFNVLECRLQVSRHTVICGCLVVAEGEVRFSQRRPLDIYDAIRIGQIGVRAERRLRARPVPAEPAAPEPAVPDDDDLDELALAGDRLFRP